MAETKAAHEVVVVTGTVLFSSTGGTSSDSQSGDGRRSDWRGKSSGGGKKWNKSSNKSRDNRHTNAGGFNARPGAPGGGPWFCFNPWGGPPPYYSPNWGGLLAQWCARHSWASTHGAPGLHSRRPPYATYAARHPTCTADLGLYRPCRSNECNVYAAVW
ncbi:hypothetical protein IHE45_10G076200 [Dioscorea alata]|uniref:Uncharacterized protein n=1 Tax=Dioscorea alata TaxID=55571 RepID=A0ACB7VCC9_DIOAL|nr:hypothetical protein IHE45_10G076200 [Dioscorea alata]